MPNSTYGTSQPSGQYESTSHGKRELKVVEKQQKTYTVAADAVQKYGQTLKAVRG
jgi:hypothetical protein